jgi:hypothetical protein
VAFWRVDLEQDTNDPLNTDYFCNVGDCILEAFVAIWPICGRFCGRGQGDLEHLHRRRVRVFGTWSSDRGTDDLRGFDLRWLQETRKTQNRLRHLTPVVAFFEGLGAPFVRSWTSVLWSSPKVAKGPAQRAGWWPTRSNFLPQASLCASNGRVATTLPLS